MNLINTNYTFAKGPSFAAQLKVQSDNKNLTGEQIELLKEKAAQIGTDTDTFEIKIGKKRIASVGAPFDDFSNCEVCPIGIKSVIGGKTTEQFIEGNPDNPYDNNLKPYFDKLQDKASAPAENLPEQIVALRQKLDEAKNRENELSCQVVSAREAYEAAVAQQGAAHNEVQKIGGDISNLEIAYKDYKNLMED